MRVTKFGAALVAVALASLWLRTGFPIYEIAGMGADDGLFVRGARSLFERHWLGQFDDLTLVKGPGYPIFIALAFAAGIPLNIAEQLVYLLVAAVVARLIFTASRSRGLTLAVFTLLAFNAVLWSEDLSRVIREGLYVSLSLAAVFFPLLMLARGGSRRRAVAAAVVVGVVWAWFWLTREEGVWIVPAVLVVLAGAVHGRVRYRGTGLRAAIAVTGPRIALSLGIAVALVGLTAAANYRMYGRFETVEVKSAPFERAYGAIYRIRVPDRQRYVVFPASARARAYAVSPAARELRPAFEGRIGAFWRRAGCDQEKLAVCPGLLAGWFQWALRDAVAAAGHYTDAGASAAFYTRLADELDAACDRGALDCLPARRTLAPPFEWHYLADAAARVPVLASLYWREGLHVVPQASSVVMPGEQRTDRATFTRFADMVGATRPTAAEAIGPRSSTAWRDRSIWKLAGVVASLLAPVLLALLVLSPFGIVAGVFAARREGDLMLVYVALASFAAVATRIALLCYLDVTAIPSMLVLYASPASGFLVVGATVGSYGAGGWARALVARVGARRRPIG